MSDAHVRPSTRSRTALLTRGAIGVVHGDIGTGPLYAFREALAQMSGPAIDQGEIVRVLSLALWALVIVVTLKHILFLSRANDHGEGGALSLMALASRATDGRWRFVLLLGAAGAAVFYGGDDHREPGGGAVQWRKERARDRGNANGRPSFRAARAGRRGRAGFGLNRPHRPRR